MRKLLAADIRRLMHSSIALAAAVMMVFTSASFVFMQTRSAREVGLERVILLFMAVYGIVAAMLISLLHGGEYSEGTLRNKLICGCDRVQVYLSQAVVSVIICSMMYLLALATALVLGVPLFDLHVSISHEMLTAWIGLMCSVYYASLYTMVTAICRSRTAAVATNMALSVGMLLLSVSISEMLIDPASGNEFWRIVLEMIPTGQAVLVNEAAIDTPVRLALLDICGAAACACVGAYAMHSMDIC